MEEIPIIEDASASSNPFAPTEESNTELPPNVEISIPSWIRCTEAGDTYTAYRVEIRSGIFTKAIFKRYRQFDVLNNTLQKLYPTAVHPPFPEKTLFNSDEELIRKRKDELESYLKGVLGVATLRSCYQVRAFLEMINMKGKVCIVTGANSGIGKTTAMGLAKFGAHVILACRSKSKTDPVVEMIKSESHNTKIEFMELDLASFESIRRFASAFIERGLPLHVLINNAGVYNASGKTVHGFETTFGINHLGHFLLTNLLLDVVKHSSPSRIVNVASDMHHYAESIDYNLIFEENTFFNSMRAYGRSKLANVMFTLDLARRLQGTGVVVNALHPGGVATDIWRSVPDFMARIVKSFLITEEEGASTVVYAAAAPEMASITGLYLVDYVEQAPNPAALDVKAQELLWQKSEEWVGLTTKESEEHHHHNHHRDDGYEQLAAGQTTF